MKFSPAKTLILFFLGLIVAGTALLSLPVSNNFSKFSFITNLFTSVSAVCVTGLSVVNIVEYYSIFDQSIILILIQLYVCIHRYYAAYWQGSFKRQVHHAGAF
jgi:trk system potassium uptake protein TrkH